MASGRMGSGFDGPPPMTPVRSAISNASHILGAAKLDPIAAGQSAHRQYLGV